MLGTRYWIPAVLILVAAFVLRVAPLPGEALEGDELFSRRIAMAPLPEAIRGIQQDMVHPPLYYFVLRCVVKVFGSSEWGIRSLSLAAGLALVAALVAVGYLFPSLRLAALLASSLVAMNDHQIFYSQQARSYATFSLLILAVVALFAASGHRLASKWHWTAVTIVAALSIYTHYFASFYFVAVLAAVWLTDWPRTTRIGWGAAVCLAAAAFLPWLLRLSAVYQEKQGIQASLGWQASATLFHLKVTFSNFIGVLDVPGGTTLSLLLGGGVALLGAWGAIPRLGAPLVSRGVRAVLATTAVLPPVMMYAASQRPFELPVFGERHVLPSQLPWVCLIALGIARLPRTWKVGTVPVWWALALLVMASSLTRTIPRSAEPRRIPYHQIASYLERHENPGPVYTTWPYGIAETVNFYRRSASPVLPLPADHESLPDKFLLLYRPWVDQELEIFRSLARRGQATPLAFFTNTYTHPKGVQVTLLTLPVATAASR